MRRAWPRCCGRSGTARCRWSAASTATAMPAASGLAAVCDVLVAAEGMHFCLSEARLGLLPATIGPYVVKALGEQASRRYFVTAERFSAAQAQALGFVHEVVAADALDAKVAEIVASLVANGPAAVRACKRLVKDVAGRAIDATLRDETARRIADIRASAEGREGVQAFLNKRDPAWKLRPRPHAPGGARRRARLGQRPAPVCGGVPHRRRRLAGLGDAARGPVAAAASGGAGRQLRDAGRRIRRRQDSGPGHAVGRRAHLHPHPRRRGAGRRRASAATPPPGPRWRRCWAARWRPPRTPPRPPRARR